MLTQSDSRPSPLSTQVEKMGAQSGGNPPEEGFTMVGTGGKTMKEREKNCKTVGCGRTFISSGRRLYCYTCRPAVLPNGASGDTPKIGKKRDSNAISPLTSDASAKAPKASFFDIFGISDSVSDIDSFLSLDKEEILKCLTVATEAHLDLLDAISGIRTEVASAKKESEDREHDLIDNISSLEREVSNSQSKHDQLARDVVDLKVLLADKELERLRRPTGPSNHCVASTATVSPPVVSSYAAATRQRDPRPTLVAKLGPKLTAEQCTESKVDTMLGLQSDGPITQHMKVSNGNLVLRFLNEADRDDANKRISESAMFDKVFVPSQSFPFLARFNDLFNVEMPARTDVPDMKRAKEKSLISQLEDSNPNLKGSITSVRILYSHEKSNSHLVRLSVNSSNLKKSVLSGGRIFLESRAHRALDVDAEKEVRRCLNCQRYGHSQKFCKSKTPICGYCSGEHKTVACPSPEAVPTCPNCKGNHSAGHNRCHAQMQAVARYKSTFNIQ